MKHSRIPPDIDNITFLDKKIKFPLEIEKTKLLTLHFKLCLPRSEPCSATWGLATAGLNYLP